MRAITIRNPWAFEIILHRKDVENRDWKPTAKPPLYLYIHAAKVPDASAFYRNMPTREQIREERYGALIGVMTVTGWHESTTCRSECSPWAMPFRWHWNLSRVHAISPVPCRGALGIWTVPDDIAAMLGGGDGT